MLVFFLVVRMEVLGRIRENLERFGGYVRVSCVCLGGIFCGF